MQFPGRKCNENAAHPHGAAGQPILFIGRLQAHGRSAKLVNYINLG